MAIDDVAIRAEGYGFDGVAINGNDVLAVYQATQGALARARGGDGPTLIECKTYRWHGHSEHDKAFYRTDEELAMWKSRDPIPTFTTYLRARHVLDDEKLKDIEATVKQTIDEAVEFAMNSPDPTPETRSPTCMHKRGTTKTRRTRSVTNQFLPKALSCIFVLSCLRGRGTIVMSKELSYLEAIREALAEEMRRDPKVFVLGEDVGAVRRRVRRDPGALRRIR